MAGANLITKALPGTLNFKEFPALSVGAHTYISRLKELSSEYAVEQRPDSKADVGMQFDWVWKSDRWEHIQDLAKDNSGIELRRQERVALGLGKFDDSSYRVVSNCPERMFSSCHLFATPLERPKLNALRDFNDLLLGIVAVEIIVFLR
jgi:hypothetical protein